MAGIAQHEWWVDGTYNPGDKGLLRGSIRMRFCEGLRVRFPSPTRRAICCGKFRNYNRQKY